MLLMFSNICHINMANLFILNLQENSWIEFTPHLVMPLMIYLIEKKDDC